MEPFEPVDGLELVYEHDSLSVSGELNRDNSAALLSWLQNAPPIAHLELSGLDIEDGIAATQAVNAVRLLAARVAHLRLEGAPQVLAHNLYRTGSLESAGNLELVAMREDEAYG